MSQLVLSLPELWADTRRVVISASLIKDNPQSKNGLFLEKSLSSALIIPVWKLGLPLSFYLTQACSEMIIPAKLTGNILIINNQCRK